MKHVMMIIANSPDPSYFRWFAELNAKEKAFKLSFIFLHTEMPPLAIKAKELGVESYHIYFNTYASKPKQYLKVCWKMYRMFKKIKPDVIQTNLFDDSLPALQAAKMAGVPIRAITKQDTGFHVNYVPSAVKYDKRNNRNATHLIACSGESREFILKNEKGDPKKIHLIHHGVDEELITKFDPKEVERIKKHYQLDGKYVLGTVSRYIELKGYITLIEAFHEALKIYPDLVFLGIGWGPQKPELDAKISSLGLDGKFILTDAVEYDSIPAFYKCMDIYLHAAIFEAFGFVIAEAMFNQRPIITTRVGASRDVLEHKKSAFLIDFKNVEQIVEGIKFFRESPQREEIIKNAYHIAKTQFSREHMWSSYRDLFLGK